MKKYNPEDNKSPSTHVRLSNRAYEFFSTASEDEIYEVISDPLKYREEIKSINSNSKPTNMRALIIFYLIASLATQVVFIWLKILGTIHWDWYLYLLPAEIFAFVVLLIYLFIKWILRDKALEDNWKSFQK